MRSFMFTKVCFAKGKLHSMSAFYDDPLFSDLTNSQTETITEIRKRGKSRDGSCSRPHKLKTKKMSKSTKQKKVEKERSERSKKLERSKNKKLKLRTILKLVIQLIQNSFIWRRKLFSQIMYIFPERNRIKSASYLQNILNENM